METETNRKCFADEDDTRDSKIFVSIARQEILITGGLETTGTVIFNNPLLSDKIAVSVSQDFCLALSGSVQVYCIRSPTAYAQWQQTTFGSILTAYTKMKMDYERARTETSVTLLVVLGTVLSMRL
jgi:hypothetical protein